MNPDTVLLILFILVAGLLLLMPSLVFPTIPFGVRIPLAYAHDPSIAAERKRYTLLLGILAGGLLVADLALGSQAQWNTLPRISLIALIVGGWGIYYISNRRLAQLKTTRNWFAGRSQAIAASITPRSNKPSGFLLVLISLIGIVIILTLAVGAWRYPSLPASLHFGFPHGLGDWTLSTSPVNTFLPVIFQVLFTLVFAGLAWVRILGSQRIDVEDPEGSLRYQQLNLFIIRGLLVLLALAFDIAFLVTGLTAWGLLQANTTLTDGIILAPLAGWLIVAPILLLTLRSDQKALSQGGDPLNRDDDHYWKLGVIYINRDDPSLLVNKRFGIGRTLNFGNPVAWVVTLVVIAIILAKVTTRS
jgi:uncharacterized membrane protein